MTMYDELIQATEQQLHGELGDPLPCPLGEEAAALTSEQVDALTPGQVAGFIDHTLLKPEATRAAIDQLCDEAIRFHMASVCVNPCHTAQCAQRLKDTGIKVATVIGFPLGANTTGLKATEADQAVADGADELDMVINLGAVKDSDWAYVRRDIQAVVEAAPHRPVKVILETGGLTEQEIVAACLLSRAAGAAFVKTSTGFLYGGATIQAVSLMRATVSTQMGVKASGGVRDLETALAMLRAGATRLGTSSGVAIVQAGGQPQPSGGY